MLSFSLYALSLYLFERLALKGPDSPKEFNLTQTKRKEGFGVSFE